MRSALLIGLLILIASCGGGGGSGGSDSSPSGDTRINIPSGGTIEIPEGALTEGTTVTAETTRTPLAPDGMQVVGKSVYVHTSSPLTGLATIHLPIPDGITDPSTLLIMRVESDGTTTFLLASVENNFLVADTLGFSSFSVVKPDDDVIKCSISGKSSLVPGERSLYRIKLSDPTISIVEYTPRNIPANWQVTGAGSLIDDDGLVATVEANEQAFIGSIIITVHFIDTRGYKYFATRKVQIDNPSINQEKFKVNLITTKPTIYAGEEFTDFTAVVSPIAVPPIIWNWDFSDGHTGTSDPTDALSFSLPANDYPLPPLGSFRSYTVTARATDSLGLTAQVTFSVMVMPPPLEAFVTGPDELEWSEPNVSGSYVGSATGGKKSYLYFWTVIPSGLSITDGLANQEISFNQPGEHLIEMTVNDFLSHESTTVFPVHITGSEALSVFMLNLPSEAETNENFSVSFQLRGGVLVASGKKGGYTFQLDWGDGNTLEENDVLLTGTPSQGIVLSISHSYSKPDSYTVKVKVFDVTGQIAEEARTIVISDPAPPPPPAEGTFTILSLINSDGVANNNPTANDIANADIQISGGAAFPTISWQRNDVITVTLLKNATSGNPFLYGIAGRFVEDPPDSGDGYLIPISSPLQYGNYSVPNTVKLDGVSYPSPALISGEMYTIQIGFDNSEGAGLLFRVN